MVHITSKRDLKEFTGYHGSGYDTDREDSIRNFRSTGIAKRFKPNVVDIKPTSLMARIKSVKNFTKEWFVNKDENNVSIRNAGFFDDVMNINKSIARVKRDHVNDFTNDLALHENDEVLQMVCLESITDELLRMKKAHRYIENNDGRASVSRQFKRLGIELINLSRAY